MRIEQVAAQLYTLRTQLDKPEKVAGTLKKLRDIGYQAVQVSGWNCMTTSDIRKALDDAGLKCIATHESPALICDTPEKVVEILNSLGCIYTAYPFPSNVKFDSLERVLELAGKLDHAGKILKDNGQVLTYHNHQIEFRKMNGKLILDILYDQTNPDYLLGEIDTYWVQYGGGDSTLWCKKLKNRLPLLHMKDFRINQDNKIEYAEVGNGNLDWKTIIPAAENSGCEWFIVEQDECPGSPFDSLKMSFDYIQAQLCS